MSDDADDAELISVLEPYGYSASTCGYCSDVPGERSATRSSRSYGLVAHQLSPRIYQNMIDEGWRRSGTFCYKPDNSSTCCPQHTIRCLATDFKASKSQRKMLNRFVRLVSEEKELGVGPRAGPSSEIMQTDTYAPVASAVKVNLPRQALDKMLSLDSVRLASSAPKDAKGKGKDNAPYSVLDTFAELECSSNEKAAHRFSVRTKRSSFSKEKFELYKLYQERVHNDDDPSERGFKRFLCDSPLTEQRATSDLAYGSYHQLYYVDEKLVAIGVIDILPNCVSSVYFIWHPDYSDLSLGKVGALREIALVQQLQKTMPRLRYYAMGYYIHSCGKMRYKAEYKPAELKDSADHTFVPIERCLPLLDNDNRAFFSAASQHSYGTAEQRSIPTDEDQDGDSAIPSPPPAGWLDPHSLPDALLVSAQVWERGDVIPLARCKAARSPAGRSVALEALAALGGKIGSEVVLVLA